MFSPLERLECTSFCDPENRKVTKVFKDEKGAVKGGKTKVI